MASEAYFDRDMGEFYTKVAIGHKDSLLLLGKEEFDLLANNKIRARQDALRLLGRAEEDQVEFENRVYEEAIIQLGQASEDISTTKAGIGANELQRKLLDFRARSEVEQGMLFHLRFPGARGIILSGDFNGWKTSVSDGGIALQKLSDSEWAVVVPEHILLPRVNPYQFKFIVETDSGKMGSIFILLEKPEN